MIIKQPQGYGVGGYAGQGYKFVRVILGGKFGNIKTMPDKTK
jgi:hypothetical protein